MEMVNLSICSLIDPFEGGRSQRVLSTPWGLDRETRVAISKSIFGERSSVFPSSREKVFQLIFGFHF